MKIETIIKLKTLSLRVALISCLLVGVFLFFDCTIVVGLLLVTLLSNIISAMVFYALEECYILRH